MPARWASFKVFSRSIKMVLPAAMAIACPPARFIVSIVRGPIVGKSSRMSWD